MSKKSVRILIAILVILILVAGGILAYKITRDNKNATQEVSDDQTEDNV